MLKLRSFDTAYSSITNVLDCTSIVIPVTTADIKIDMFERRISHSMTKTRRIDKRVSN
jgi:hypothetical protein